MKIEELFGEDINGAERYQIKVDGESKIFAQCLSECPEDAMVERDLNFVRNIIPIMKQSYDAGKRGEEFKVIQGKIKD